MRINVLCLGVLAALLSASALSAQDLAGDWQGALGAGTPTQLRLLLHMEKGASGAWNATLVSIDQTPDLGAGVPADPVTVQGADIKFTIPAFRGNYEGRIAADGNSIVGTWSQGRPLPLEFRRETDASAWKDPSPHSVQFVNVERDVKLEVLDWGGQGRTLVLLAGLGNTAHIFDRFAPKLAARYHVYGITRRGFGASSAPSSGYSADRLGDDVLAVIDTLKMSKPVLAGHSIAGEELSSVGSRFPEKIAGLIYLDAGYAYGYYDPTLGDVFLDSLELQRKLQQLTPGGGQGQNPALVRDLLQTSLPQLEKDLQEQLKIPSAPPAVPVPVLTGATRAIIDGQQKYTKIQVPILAIFAVPHDLGPLGTTTPEARAAQTALDEALVGAQATAFERGLPSARVVRVPHANHYVFLSNEADVLREMETFLGGLK